MILMSQKQDMGYEADLRGKNCPRMTITMARADNQLRRSMTSQREMKRMGLYAAIA